MKKFFLSFVVLLLFVSKGVFGQTAHAGSDDSSGTTGDYSFTYGYFNGGYMIQTGNSLPEGASVVLISVESQGYYTSDSSSPDTVNLQGYNDDDHTDAGHFAEIYDYDVNLTAYDHAVVTFKMYYTIGATEYLVQHAVTYTWY